MASGNGIYLEANSLHPLGHVSEPLYASDILLVNGVIANIPHCYVNRLTYVIYVNIY